MTDDLSSPLIYDGRVHANPRPVDPGECTCTYEGDAK